MSPVNTQQCCTAAVTVCQTFNKPIFSNNTADTTLTTAAAADKVQQYGLAQTKTQKSIEHKL